jgi:hypothetical protein
MKLPPKGKATPSNDHGFPWARCCSKSSRDGKFHPFNRIFLTVQKGDLSMMWIAQDLGDV